MVALLDQHGKPFHRESPSRVRALVGKLRSQLRAAYDAAKTTTDNQRHWVNADGLSAAAANSPFVRSRLRMRARYECQESNSYAKGMCLTLANHTIGKGPRLQLLTRDEAANHAVEVAFRRWARTVKLAAKLRTMKMAKTVDGESFCMPISNRRLPNPVKLDLRVIEGDQVATPDLNLLKPNQVDGVEFDSDGNPLKYHLLKAHPGDLNYFTGRNPLEYDRIDAEKMIHLFREDRAGQRRGVPEVTPALPLFAQLRRFTLAVIAAAETAAELSGIIHTDAPPGEEPEELEEWESIPIELRSLLTLPQGWKATQLRAEQPTTTYEMFRDAILNEIARC